MHYEQIRLTSLLFFHSLSIVDHNSHIFFFEKKIFEIEDTQRNANIENMGLLQEINYMFAKDEYLTFRVWLEKDWNLVQQTMESNLYNPDVREYYKNSHIRIWGGYKNRKKPFKFEVNGGYVYDKGEHNGFPRPS